MSTACRPLKSRWSQSETSIHPTMVTQVNMMVTNGWLTCFSFHVNWPSDSWDKAISNSDLETPRSKSWVGQRARLYSQPIILLIHFLFISHQSNQQLLRYSYFEIWPWNIESQGHAWGQSTRSHIISSIQLMLFLFISHQSDQSFLRYGQNSAWPWKKHLKLLKKIC